MCAASVSGTVTLVQALHSIRQITTHEYWCWTDTCLLWWNTDFRASLMCRVRLLHTSIRAVCCKFLQWRI